MKKISAIVAGLVIASSSVSAMDIQYFLGAGAERVKMNSKWSDSTDSETTNLYDTAVKIKTGIILDKAHRISLSYSKPSESISYSDPGYSENSKFSVTQVLANYDYLYGITDDFRVGGGAHLGLAKFENKGSNSNGDSWKMSDTGFAYGVQLAAIYDITKNVEFELGLGHTRYTAELKTNSDKDELKYSTSGYAGINFKF